jgi:HEAT repeat protein
MLWWTRLRLKSADPQVRIGAAHALAAAGEIRAVPALIKALEDNPGEEWHALVEALGTIGHPSATDALIAALKGQTHRTKSRIGKVARGEDLSEYKAIAKALAAVSTDSPGHLIGLLDSEDKDVRRWAAFALGRTGNHKALDPLVARLQDNRSEVRQAAARALGDLGTPRAVPALILLVTGKDPETRRAAVEALGAIGAAESIDALGAAARDLNEPLQLAALEALRRIGGLRAGWKIRALLETGRKSVREAASAALNTIQFENASAEDRAAGAVLRGDFETAQNEGQSAVEAIISALDSRDPGHRLKAVRALAAFTSERTIRSLLGGLDDNDQAVQEAAADVLAGAGQPAVAGLIDSLGSARSSVRKLAAEALGRIGAARAAEALLESGLQHREDVGDDSGCIAAAGAALNALSFVLTRAQADIPQNVLERITTASEHSFSRRGEDHEGSDMRRLTESWAGIQDLARHELKRRGYS